MFGTFYIDKLSLAHNRTLNFKKPTELGSPSSDNSFFHSLVFFVSDVWVLISDIDATGIPREPSVIANTPLQGTSSALHIRL